jgi:hypothetical protein
MTDETFYDAVYADYYTIHLQYRADIRTIARIFVILTI